MLQNEQNQKKSERTLLKHKLKSLFGLSMSRVQLYRAICAYNDQVLKAKNFSAAVSELNDNKFELNGFAEFAESRGARKIFTDKKALASDMRSYSDL